MTEKDTQNHKIFLKTCFLKKAGFFFERKKVFESKKKFRMKPISEKNALCRCKLAARNAL